jgi:hypothetical protein
MVNVALGTTPVSACVAGDDHHDGAITVDEIARTRPSSVASPVTECFISIRTAATAECQ